MSCLIIPCAKWKNSFWLVLENILSFKQQQQKKTLRAIALQKKTVTRSIFHEIFMLFLLPLFSKEFLKCQILWRNHVCLPLSCGAIYSFPHSWWRLIKVQKHLQAAISASLPTCLNCQKWDGTQWSVDCTIIGGEKGLSGSLSHKSLSLLLRAIFFFFLFCHLHIFSAALGSLHRLFHRRLCLEALALSWPPSLILPVRA